MLVYVERVGLHPDIVLQPLLVAEEVEPGRLGLRDLVLQEKDGVVEDADLVHQSVVRRVVARLDIRPLAPPLQTGLRDLRVEGL